MRRPVNPYNNGLIVVVISGGTQSDCGPCLLVKVTITNRHECSTTFGEVLSILGMNVLLL